MWKSKKTPNLNSNPNQSQKKTQAHWQYVLDHLSTHEGDVVLREHVRLYEQQIQLKKHMRMLLWMLVLLVITVAMLLWAFLYQYPKNRYIFTHNNQEICRINQALAHPVGAGVLINFAQNAVTELYRYDYVNFQAHMQGVLNRFFTLNGRYRYYESLESSGNIAKVESNKLISRAFSTKSPQIEKEYQRAGKTVWELAVPIKMEFYVGSSELQDKPQSVTDYIVFLTMVQESPTMDNPRGLAIDGLVLKPL